MSHVTFSDLCHFTPKQLEATEAADAHRYTLYGGARGPGKSYWLRWWLLRFLLRQAGQGMEGVRAMLACEDYPALNDRHLSKVQFEFPDWLGTYNGQEHEFRLSVGGGVLCFRNLDKPAKYQSAEFAAIGVDELTKNTSLTFNILRGSLRWPGIEDTRFVAATNPGDVGHLWVKQYWIDGIFPPELEPFRDEFSFVRALPKDNPYLSQSYWNELNSLPADLSRAWVHGDWDVFAGQAFGQWMRHRHVIEPRELPTAWPRWRCVDWGYVKPFCCLWLCQDPDSGRVYVYRELYAAGLTDREQARKVKEMTAERVLWTLADPSMWTKKTHEGLTFSTADEYQAEGVTLEPADNDRLTGVRRVRQALQDGLDGTPMLQVFSTCANLIRTLPALPYDGRNVEDVDTDAEDHAYDALRYGLMRGKQQGRKPQPRPHDPFKFTG
jgi:hypothetical protein